MKDKHDKRPIYAVLIVTFSVCLHFKSLSAKAERNMNA